MDIKQAFEKFTNCSDNNGICPCNSCPLNKEIKMEFGASEDFTLTTTICGMFNQIENDLPS